MRLSRSVIRLGLALAAAIATPAAVATASGSGSLAALANRSVVAVRDGSALSTGFAYKGSLVIGAASRGPVTVITAGGSVESVTPFRQGGEISAARGRAVSLSALVQETRSIHRNESAFVLGSPLGYGRSQIERIMIRFGRRRTGSLVILGKLRHTLLGAPVVTSTGKLLGAVEAVGRVSWELMPASSLAALTAAPPKASSGVSVFLIIGLVLAIGFASAAALVLRQRRRRARPGRREADLPRQSPTPASSTFNDAATQELFSTPQPLVQRRTPSEGHASDDFEIVVKSHEGDE